MNSYYLQGALKHPGGSETFFFVLIAAPYV